MHNKIKNFVNKHNTILKVSASVLLTGVGFSLGIKFADKETIKGLKCLAGNEQMRYMVIDGEKYIISIMKESDLKLKIKE
jgi:hypothetical protein